VPSVASAFAGGASFPLRSVSRARRLLHLKARSAFHRDRIGHKLCTVESGYRV
jgi:hypothetical protein